MSNRKARFERRLKKRRELQALASALEPSLQKGEEREEKRKPLVLIYRSR